MFQDSASEESDEAQPLINRLEEENNKKKNGEIR